MKGLTGTATVIYIGIKRVVINYPLNGVVLYRYDGRESTLRHSYVVAAYEDGYVAEMGLRNWA